MPSGTSTSAAYSSALTSLRAASSIAGWCCPTSGAQRAADKDLQIAGSEGGPGFVAGQRLGRDDDDPVLGGGLRGEVEAEVFVLQLHAAKGMAALQVNYPFLIAL